jgi:homotetrameric cytidine deaminase
MTYEIHSSEVQSAYQKAMVAQQNAHAPYSKYFVGACLKIKNKDQYVAGCNVENASYGGTVCAERVAIFSQVAASGASEFDFIVVVTNDSPAAPPCAFCLQVMSEFFSPSTPVFLANKEKVEKKYLFKDLLPLPFVLKK